MAGIGLLIESLDSRPLDQRSFILYFGKPHAFFPSQNDVGNALGIFKVLICSRRLENNYIIFAAFVAQDFWCAYFIKIKVLDMLGFLV